MGQTSTPLCVLVPVGKQDHRITKLVCQVLLLLAGGGGKSLILDSTGPANIGPRRYAKVVLFLPHLLQN